MKRFRISVLFLCLALAALPQGCEKGQVFELSCVVVEYIVNPKFQVLPQDQGASKGNSVEMPLASHHPPRNAACMGAYQVLNILQCPVLLPGVPWLQWVTRMATAEWQWKRFLLPLPANRSYLNGAGRNRATGSPGE